MRWVIGIALVLLLLGPLRRRVLYPSLKTWRLGAPFVLGLYMGSLLVNRLMPGSPNWMKVVGPLSLAVIGMGVGRRFLDDLLGPADRKRRNDG